MMMMMMIQLPWICEALVQFGYPLVLFGQSRCVSFFRASAEMERHTHTHTHTSCALLWFSLSLRILLGAWPCFFAGVCYRTFDIWKERWSLDSMVISKLFWRIEFISLKTGAHKHTQPKRKGTVKHVKCISNKGFLRDVLISFLRVLTVCRVWGWFWSTHHFLHMFALGKSCPWNFHELCSHALPALLHFAHHLDRHVSSATWTAKRAKPGPFTKIFCAATLGAWLTGSKSGWHSGGEVEFVAGGVIWC